MEVDKNSPLNIINYWIDVELSSPPMIKTNNATKKSDVKWHQKVSFKYNDDVIWSNPLKEKIDTPDDWVHRVYLGIFSTEIVIKEFSKEIDDVNELKSKHHTCLVSFLVDGEGKPIKDTIVVPEYLSYIAYAKTNDKSLYRSFEERIKDIYATWLFTVKKNKLFLEKEDLNEFIKQILIELNWELLADSYVNNDFVCLAYTESLSITKNRHLKFDSEITHSLIANDLKKVAENIKDGVTDSSLAYYLNNRYDSIEKKDVLKDIRHYRKGLSPSEMSNASWPTKNNHKLVSSQQFSVNKIFTDLSKDDAGVFSVNGPPGTGKTTLLREVITNIIYERAVALLEFKDNPKEAFYELGKITYKLSDKGHKTIYGLNPKLSGYEIVVASSNNGAVQNITKELPLIDDIDEKWHDELSYLKEIAKNVNAGMESWGVLSATLGNKSNNYNFISNFLFSNTDDDGNSTRSIFDFLKGHQYFSGENVLDWKLACQKFESQKNKVDRMKEDLDSMDYGLQNAKTHEDKARELDKVFKLLKKELKELNVKLEEIEHNYKYKKQEYKDEVVKLKNIKEKGKSFLNKLFKKNPEKDQSDKVVAIKKEIKKIKRMYDISKEKRKDLLQSYQETKSVYKSQLVLVKRIKSINENHGDEISGEIPNDSFWEQEVAIIQKASPWLSDKLQDERVRLFISAMDLHKSFMIENADFIIDNLYSFKDVLDNDFHERDIYAQAIWQTFFMVVPVVSTTFSSLGNLFDMLKGGSLGWLLIDEAGQSTPQAPVGGLWRCKKAIVVGDPLQVEPVINIEKKLSDVLMEKNNVSLDWNSTNYSAQQIADRNNEWGTNIKLGRRNIWVGSPLRVHRRCNDPMFSISNKIAYNDMMIFGKPNNLFDDIITKTIGETRWVSIKGAAVKDSHWVAEEGDYLVKMLSEIVLAGGGIPSLYIITPFKSISFEIGRMLKRRQNEWVPDDLNIDDKVLGAWLMRSVGTIHSFQGKEADSVILVMGGNIMKPGAITWVCEEPNILNVAATRAKNSFYILGNPNVWNKGVFGLLKDMIEIDKTHESNIIEKETKEDIEKISVTDEDEDLKDFLDDDIELE
jgi:hypothetical protein